jgi:segregation and condensation protein A
MQETTSQNEADAGATPPAETQDAGPDAFVEGAPRGEPDGEPKESLIVDLDGFEGPLDVLLMLARNQKVDLTRISILALAEQYLEFINRAARMELDLAADYLVMASWLAYLKSKLLLPPPEEEEGPSGAEMAARLAFQLQRLEAMRHASQAIFARQRLGVHLFQRGTPEGVRVVKTSEYQGTLYDLLKAYSDQRLKTHDVYWEPKKLPIMAIEAARKRLENMLGMMFDWGRIDAYLPTEHMSPELRRSALASMFSAALVMVKNGEMEIRQSGAYQPLFMRRRQDGVTPNVDDPEESDDEIEDESTEE